MITPWLAASALSQTFARPLAWPAPGSTVYVIYDDGTRFEGELGSLSERPDRAPTYKLKGDAGKHKIDDARVVEAGVRVTAPLAPFSDARPFDASAPPPEWVRFLRVPVADDRTALAMVVNPGFDHRLQVLVDPEAHTGGVAAALAGVPAADQRPTSWLVWPVGAAAPERVERKGYVEAWDHLFGDCPALPRPDPVKWADFEAHVFEADKACGGSASPAPAAPAAPAEPPPG